MTRIAGLGLIVLAAGAFACGSTQQEEANATPDPLRSDPSAAVTTTDPNVQLLGGYNAFLDRATPMSCLVANGPRAVDVGNVQGSFYLRHVKTREELAKELDVELGASVKAPQGSLDASTKVVKTFKQSTTTVTFLVRAVRSYAIANRTPLALEPSARAMLEAGSMPEFLQKCGGSFAQSVRYEAQVLGVLQFEAKTEESARTIESSFGGRTPSIAATLVSATADLKAKAVETASKNDASLSVTVTASGFVSDTSRVGSVTEQSFEQIDLLHRDMVQSFETDLANDRANLDNHQRNVRPSVVGQASYGSVPGAPLVDYSRLNTTLGRAEEFVRGIAPVYLRMERTYDDEVMRFLGDTSNQYRYNLSTAPKLNTSELVSIAQNWAVKFGPDGSRRDGSLVEPLRVAIERCTRAAGDGNYNACTTDPVVDGDKAAAEAALDEYGRTGRILPLTAWRPRLDTAVSYYNAESECAEISMRLPKRSEMHLIAPAVTALSGPAGEVWVASDSSCKKLFFANGNGQGTFGCEDAAAEPLPYVKDRPVVCVGRSGPLPARPAP